MIICAAIKLINTYGMFDMELEEPEELVVCGHRHVDCFHTIINLKEHWYRAKKIQGFINHKGEFLDRQEALKHARECGQISSTHRHYQEDHNITELYSEDLY